MQANSVLTSVLICQDSLSHPAVLFETDPGLKLSARHESLVCPVPGDPQSSREMVEEGQQGHD